MNLHFNPSSKSLVKQYQLHFIEEELNELPSYLSSLLKARSVSKIASQIIDHVLNTKGKLLRPSLFLLSCNLVRYQGDKRLHLAAVTEFIHTASLLHDDVIDNSTMRRNQQTCNTIWGAPSSVLAGDFIYSTACDMMAQTGNLEIVRCFSEAIAQMSDGELLQLDHLGNLNLTLNEYFQIVERKTAKLLSVCAKSAGLIAQSSNAEIIALEEFGLNLGFAFQLLDDALDYDSTFSIFGKERFSDWKEKKVTYPLIYLYHCCDSFDKNWLEVEWQKGSLLPESLMEKYKIIDNTVLKAKEYTDKALKSLCDHFPSSPARKSLEDLALALTYRNQ